MSVASPFFNALIGERVTHVWRGHGSAIFVEFGSLTPRMKRDKSPGQPDGEITLMIEWSWRIERPRSILGGSWSPERRWLAMFEKIIGATVTEIQVFGVLPEICVSLSNGLRIASFMTANGQPVWALITRNPKIGSLCVRRGALHVEPPDL